MGGAGSYRAAGRRRGDGETAAVAPPGRRRLDPRAGRAGRRRARARDSVCSISAAGPAGCWSKLAPELDRGAASASTSTTSSCATRPPDRSSARTAPSSLFETPCLRLRSRSGWSFVTPRLRERLIRKGGARPPVGRDPVRRRRRRGGDGLRSGAAVVAGAQGGPGRPPPFDAAEIRSSGESCAGSWPRPASSTSRPSALPVSTDDLPPRAFVETMLAPAARQIDADLLDGAAVQRGWDELRRMGLRRAGGFGYALGWMAGARKAGVG